MSKVKRKLIGGKYKCNLHNALKLKLARLILIQDMYEYDKSILNHNIWLFKNDFYIWLDQQTESVQEIIKSNMYYSSIERRLNDH